MKILGIDTTSNTVSVSVVDEQKVIAEFTINNKKTHSETLMPMIDSMLKISEVDKNSIDYVACSNGPGSFTGLRIGIATAKGICRGLNKKLVPVPTLDALAYNIYKTDSTIVPIMDARRNQVYTCFYEWENNKLIKKSDYMAIEMPLVLDKLKQFDKPPIFLGDGVLVHKQMIIDNLKNVDFSVPINNQQRASSVACYAFDLINEGKAIDYRDVEITYLRKSQAERELEEKLNAKN